MKENIIKQEKEKRLVKSNNNNITIFLFLFSIIGSLLVTSGLLLIIRNWQEYSPITTYLMLMWPFIALFILSLIRKNGNNIIRWIKNIISLIYLVLPFFYAYRNMTRLSSDSLFFMFYLFFSIICLFYFILIRYIIFLTKSFTTNKLIIMAIILLVPLLLSILMTIF